MKSEDIYNLSLASVVCGLLGTFLLAVSLSRWMRAISLSLDAREQFKDTILSSGNIINVTGADKHRSKAATWSKWFTYIGLFLIVVASVCQVIVLYFSSLPKT